MLGIHRATFICCLRVQVVFIMLINAKLLIFCVTKFVFRAQEMVISEGLRVKPMMLAMCRHRYVTSRMTGQTMCSTDVLLKEFI